MYEVKKASAGLGLFATKDFKRGDRIVQYTGPRILFAKAKNNAKYLMEVDDGWVIDGKGRDNIARYINHSCHPNAEAIVEDGDTEVFIYARRAIRVGDEITMHYGEDYWGEFIKPKGCRCLPCTKRRVAEQAAAEKAEPKAEPKAVPKAPAVESPERAEDLAL